MGSEDKVSVMQLIHELGSGSVTQASERRVGALELQCRDQSLLMKPHDIGLRQQRASGIEYPQIWQQLCFDRLNAITKNDMCVWCVVLLHATLVLKKEKINNYFYYQSLKKKYYLLRY